MLTMPKIGFIKISKMRKSYYQTVLSKSYSLLTHVKRFVISRSNFLLKLRLCHLKGIPPRLDIFLSCALTRYQLCIELLHENTRIEASELLLVNGIGICLSLLLLGKQNLIRGNTLRQIVSQMKKKNEMKKKKEAEKKEEVEEGGV